MMTLELSCMIFYGFWRFFDEYYLYKQAETKGCFKINYIKVVLMTYLICTKSIMFPFLIGLGIFLSLTTGFIITLLPMPSESLQLDVRHGLTVGWGKTLFDSILSLILFWIISQ